MKRKYGGVNVLSRTHNIPEVKYRKFKQACQRRGVYMAAAMSQAIDLWLKNGWKK